MPDPKFDAIKKLVGDSHAAKEFAAKVILQHGVAALRSPEVQAHIGNIKLGEALKKPGRIK